NSGGAACLAKSMIQACNSLTLSGFWSARLVDSEGSFERSKSSTRGGNSVVQTSFQFPFRTAARYGSTLYTISSRGLGLPSLIACQTSTPSSGLFFPSCAPTSPVKVGYMSTMCIIWLTTPGLIRPGQFASATTRVPPSYTDPLPSRYGPLLGGNSPFTSASPT